MVQTELGSAWHIVKVSWDDCVDFLEFDMGSGTYYFVRDGKRSIAGYARQYRNDFRWYVCHENVHKVFDSWVEGSYWVFSQESIRLAQLSADEGVEVG